MVSRGDGTITLAWDKPTLLASKITKYAITWQGGSVEIGAERERATIAGLDNNTVYTFGISGLNKVGWSDVRQSPALQPLGTPAAPEGVTATDLNTGNAATTVRVSWTDTAANGPGPTLYTVYVSVDGAAARTVPGCDRISATTCNDAREYDGTSYVYSVRASNQPTPEKPNFSPLSTGALFEAVGKPAVWGTWSWRATGASQEIEVSYTVPESRGDASRVEVLVDGGVAKTFSEQRGAATTRVLVAGNEEPHSVALRVCNERAPTGCTTSNSQQVQSYGPLGGMLDPIGDPAVSGKNLVWTVTGSSNGDPAVLAISINGGPADVVRLGGVGRFSVPKSFTTAGYSEKATISVRLYDDAPGQRGEDSESRQDQSAPPPPPQVAVARGAPCNDDGVTYPNRGACKRGAEDTFRDCVVETCSRIRLGLYGWENWTSNGKIYCRVVQHPNDWFELEPRGELGVGFEGNVGWYSPGGFVQIGCRGNNPNDQEFFGAAQWTPSDS
jgi:hypothetical protein